MDVIIMENENVRKATLISSIVSAIIGIIMIFSESFTQKALAIILIILIGVTGLGILIRGIVSSIENKKILDLIFAIFLFILTVVMIINIELITKLVAMIIGVFLILFALGLFYSVYQMRTIDGSKWYLVLIFALITLILGVLFVYNPTSLYKLFNYILGFYLLVSGILGLVFYFGSKE